MGISENALKTEVVSLLFSTPECPALADRTATGQVTPLVCLCYLSPGPGALLQPSPAQPG